MDNWTDTLRNDVKLSILHNPTDTVEIMYAEKFLQYWATERDFLKGYSYTCYHENVFKNAKM